MPRLGQLWEAHRWFRLCKLNMIRSDRLHTAIVPDSSLAAAGPCLLFLELRRAIISESAEPWLFFLFYFFLFVFLPLPLKTALLQHGLRTIGLFRVPAAPARISDSKSPLNQRNFTLIWEDRL